MEKIKTLKRGQVLVHAELAMASSTFNFHLVFSEEQ